jgi:predicted heme/steroid binding protein
MKPSVENQIAAVKQEAGTPQKQSTRQEIEKYDKEDDCWIVVGGKVYDAASVLKWHPGGKAAIVGHAGKVHAETSSEIESIHDGYAYQKLKGKQTTGHHVPITSCPCQHLLHGGRGQKGGFGNRLLRAHTAVS